MEIKNVRVYGLEESIIRSGYPMSIGDVPTMELHKEIMVDKDYDRASKLGKCKTGTGHDNFFKGVIVQFDLKYTQYFTPQLQRYNWIDLISSQSKMHRLTKNKLSENNCNKYVMNSLKTVLNQLITYYNAENSLFPFTLMELGSEGGYDVQNKEELFHIIVSNLPAGYEQWMGITTNYLQLKTIYQQRKNHKLKDWHYFCQWLENLPMFKEMGLKDNV